MIKLAFLSLSAVAVAGMAVLTASPAHSQGRGIDYVTLQSSTPGTAQAGHSNITGTAKAGAFAGNGTNLTFLNAASIKYGLIAHGRLPSNIPRYNLAGAFTAAQTFPSDGITVGGTQFVLKDGRVGISNATPATTFDMKGVFQLSDSTGARKIAASIFSSNNNGQIFTYNDGGTQICGFGISASNGGYISCADAAGTIQAGIFVNSSGNGHVFGDIKAFRVPNPRDLRTDIWYAAIEGPEAAIYVRGKGHLVDGRAVIELPEHFRDMAIEESLTVQLTPSSADSEGLAIVNPALAGVEVRELRRGQGNYAFYWEAKATRKGREDWQPVRPWTDGLPVELDKEKAWQARLNRSLGVQPRR